MILEVNLGKKVCTDANLASSTAAGDTLSRHMHGGPNTRLIPVDRIRPRNEPKISTNKLNIIPWQVP